MSCADDAAFRSSGRTGKSRSTKDKFGSGADANGMNSGIDGDSNSNKFLDPFDVNNDFSGDGYKDQWDVGLDGDSGKQKFMLTIEPNTTMPVDYLFVVDNSTSMDAIIGECKEVLKK
jgi:hypothetical protein